MSFRFSKQEQYGILALTDLVKSSNSNKTIQIKSISEKRKIPRRFLEQIFNKFKQADLIQGKRGLHGGYRLARSAEDITLRQVVEALRSEDLKTSLDPRLGGLWLLVHNKHEEFLDSVNLKEMLTLESADAINDLH